MVNGNGTETGHIIVTTIGGRNGQPKQVHFAQFKITVVITCWLRCGMKE